MTLLYHVVLGVIKFMVVVNYEYGYCHNVGILCTGSQIMKENMWVQSMPTGLLDGAALFLLF